MLETPHVWVGAALASKIPNPLLSLPLALASHFILEKIPHWNPHLYSETQKFGRPTPKSTVITTIDSSLALFSGSLIASRSLPDVTQFLTILAACFLAVLPDLVEAPYLFLNYRTPVIKKWIKWQRSIQIDAPLFSGILTQIAVVAASLWWLI